MSKAAMPFARSFRRAVLFAAAMLACGGAIAKPACGGVDLVERMRRSDKAAYAAFKAEAAATPAGDGLFWKIEKPGVEPSHLFGTFHASDPRLMAVVERVTPLARSARSAATELGDLSKGAKTLALARVAFSAISASNHSLDLVGDPKRRAALVALAKQRGLDEQAVDKMAPWMLIGVFALPACEIAKQDRVVVDDKIVEVAKEGGAAVEALESVEEQIEAISTIDPKLVGEYLGMIADRPAMIDDGFATMVGLYARSQIGAAMPALKHGMKMTKEQFAMNDSFSKRLLGDRNETMRRRATPLLEKGRAFVAVGALHLSGKDGLVELLRRDGWTVTKVF
jgi:hypothetical protein